MLLGLNIQSLNQVSNLSNRVLVLRIYQNQPYLSYMKFWFGTGFGSIGLKSGLVNLQRAGTTRCTFGFGS